MVRWLAQRLPQGWPGDALLGLVYALALLLIVLLLGDAPESFRYQQL